MEKNVWILDGVDSEEGYKREWEVYKILINSVASRRAPKPHHTDVVVQVRPEFLKTRRVSRIRVKVLLERLLVGLFVLLGMGMDRTGKILTSQMNTEIRLAIVVASAVDVCVE